MIIKPKEQKLIKVKAPFIDKMSGLAIAKILDGGSHSTFLIKLKFTQNLAVLDIVNKGTETMIFRPEEMIGIVDVRSLGYYKIKQGIPQENLSRYYKFERAEKLWKIFQQIHKHIEERKRTKNIRGQISVVGPKWQMKIHDR